MTDGPASPRPPQAPRHHFEPPDLEVARDVPTGSLSAPRGPRAPRPWYRLILGQWPLTVTLLGVFAGVVIMGTGYWRRGATLVGLTITAAAILRWLPPRLVGLLAVRARWFDTLVLLVLGVGILVTAWVVPPIRK